jgi:hypothetical protein
MKRIVLLIVTFASICCYGQGRANKANKNIEKLIDEAFVRGTNVDSVYWLFNNENKSLTVNDICCYLQEKGLYPLTYTEKNILKFGEFHTVADKVKFTNKSGYAKMVFDMLKGDKYSDVNYNRLKHGGTFFYFQAWASGAMAFERVDNVSWSGNMVNGLLDGKGVGFFEKDNNYCFFEGDFISGMATEGLALNTFNGTKKLGSSTTFYTKIELCKELYNNVTDSLLRQAIMGFVRANYRKDAEEIMDAYDKLLTINTTKFKSYLVRRWRGNIYLRFYNEYKPYYNHESNYNGLTTHYERKRDSTQSPNSLVIRIYGDGSRTFVHGDGFRFFVNAYKNFGVDSLDLIPKIAEINELLKVADVYNDGQFGQPVGYAKEKGWLFKSEVFDVERVERNISDYFDALKISEEKSKSDNAPFKVFYAKVYPKLKAKEDYFRSGAYRKACEADYYGQKQREYKEMCDNCIIDGDKTTVPAGYEPEKGGLFFGHPAQSKESGSIHLHNGNVVYWKYVYEGKSRQIEANARRYSSEKEMMDDIIKECKKKYCE